MFRLEVELQISFVPPMEDHGRGIPLRRTFELPFAPSENVSLTGEAFNPHAPSPEGFQLKRVTWDVGKQVFIASISLECHDHPIAFVPDELRAWIECGWRLGSHQDEYQQADLASESVEESSAANDVTMDGAEPLEDWEDQAERLPSQKPRSRPKEFNKLLRAMVREMAEFYNNWRVAYAIDSTQMFFTEKELRAEKTRDKAAFLDALVEFDRMPLDEQLKWQTRVTRSYPRLDRIISESDD